MQVWLANVPGFSIRVHFWDEPIFQLDELLLDIGPAIRVLAQFFSCDGRGISELSVIHEDFVVETREEYLGHRIGDTVRNS